MRKYIFTQECFYLQGILDDINEQDTSFLDCKHKYMMKSGAAPDKVGVLQNCMVSQSELISRGYHPSWCYLSFFRDGISPFKMASDLEIEI